MRDGHRAEAERLLVRAVEEEVRRAGGRADAGTLLARGRGALDALAESAADEYAAYTRALDAAAAEQHPLSAHFNRASLATPALVTVVAAIAACGADLVMGAGGSTAVGSGVVVAVAGAATTVARVTAAHWPAAHRSAGAQGQPGGTEQLRLEWLTALEVRGIRPYLDQQRMLAVPQKKTKSTVPPQLRGTDKSAAARRRSTLDQSFGHLPDAGGPFAGRRQELAQITQWVHAARASTETRPTVVVLHGAPGSGRTTLAVRAAHQLKDQFRGACVVDLRGATRDEPPLSTRDALLHLLNRLGAPREQLLFRERSSPEQQLKRLSELYHQHLTGLAVTVVLDDASDPAQVRALVPERSDSLVLVTSGAPLELPGDLRAWVHQLPVDALDAAGSDELLREAAEEPESPYDAEATDQVAELCGGLPLALRVAGSSLGRRSTRELAAHLGSYRDLPPVERALALRYSDQPEQGRRLLRRLALA
ncbi:ATP-binding protein, partial [Streptomyces sp. SID10853]|uniref:ATP-binding protein n=1 Tax=Streptomyces sp. SID10853 TaxID=2706028 RepID=UPI0013C05616